jgi:outer membrane protein OmpA-like peptidoglycan-associated protein
MMKKIVKLTLGFLLIFGIVSCATKSSVTIADEVQQKIDSSNLSEVTVSVDEQGVKIVTTGLLFAADSAKLTPEITKQLDELGEILKSYDGHQVLVEGHTANVGDEKSIQLLSEQRAQAIADYLINLHDIKMNKTTVVGLGASQPVATNDTKEGRAKNRRVEITILN